MRFTRKNVAPARTIDAVRQPRKNPAGMRHPGGPLKKPGYSGTPLVKKLGIKDGSRLFLSGAPKNYLELVAPLPERVLLVPRIDSRTDIAHIFSSGRTELAGALRATLAKMKQDGVIWVSWPKKSSRVPTDITEDVIREVALPMGLVDIKVCAVDDVWSGLKLVVRRAARRPR
jgi:DUF3052 family protein